MRRMTSAVGDLDQADTPFAALPRSAGRTAARCDSASLHPATKVPFAPAGLAARRHERVDRLGRAAVAPARRTSAHLGTFLRFPRRRVAACVSVPRVRRAQAGVEPPIRRVAPRLSGDEHEAAEEAQAPTSRA